jgi:hypothetical protein
MRYTMESAIVTVLVEVLALPRRQIFLAIWDAQIFGQVFLRHESYPLRWISDDSSNSFQIIPVQVALGNSQYVKGS